MKGIFCPVQIDASKYSKFSIRISFPERPAQLQENFKNLPSTRKNTLPPIKIQFNGL
jgi:hypothetical protein